MFVFFYYSKYPPYGHYYVVAEDMDEVMKHHPITCRLVYSHRKPLDQIGNLNDLPVPKVYGGGCYQPLHMFEDEEGTYPIRHGGSKSKTNQQTRSFQDRYRRRKLCRYPGKAGEEEDE